MKFKFFFTIFTILIVFSYRISATVEEDIIIQLPDTVYLLPDKFAEFENGDIEKFQQYAQERLVYIDTLVVFKKNTLSKKSEYVSENEQTKLTTRVSFTVDKSGNVVNVKIDKSCGVSKLDLEALRVVKNSPKWEPAKYQENNVSQNFGISLYFKKKK